MSHLPTPKNLLLAATKLALVFLVVGSSTSRTLASCGDYLEHRQIGKNNSLFDPQGNHERGNRCEGGECKRAPSPLPVDPMSLRVTVREISTAEAPCFNTETPDPEQWSKVIQAKPDSVFHGVPLKPPIL